MHGQLPYGARCPNFDLSLYLHPFYVCECIECSGDIAPKHIQKGSKVARAGPFYFKKNDHFCMKVVDNLLFQIKTKYYG